MGQGFQFNQTSANRNQRNCAQAVGVKLRYVEAEWPVLGDPLELEALADVTSLALPEGGLPQVRHRLEHCCARYPEITLVT